MMHEKCALKVKPLLKLEYIFESIESLNKVAHLISSKLARELYDQETETLANSMLEVLRQGMVLAEGINNFTPGAGEASNDTKQVY